MAAGLGASTFVPGTSYALFNSRRSANDRILVGLIGCAGMGWPNLENILEADDNVECAALCDVDENVLNRRAAELEEKTGKKPLLYKDYRAMLDNPDIDVVIVATPDHWHCLQTVHACQAGKDVYVEKPVGKDIAECDVMLKAARKYDRVVTSGQWQRSAPHWLDAIEFLKTGALGQVRVARSWCYLGWLGRLPVRADSPVPEGVDYDMWLGPAPLRPFNRNRFHFQFRWFWDYAGGLMTDWGVHLLDILMMGMDVEAPKSVVSMGGKYGFPDDAWETPDTQHAIYEFDGFSMIWEHASAIPKGLYDREHGVAFVGNNATLVIDRAGWEVLDTGNNESIRDIQTTRSDNRDLLYHMQDFLKAVRNRTRPSADIEPAANTAIVSSLGNIALRTNERIEWDHAARRITNSARANELLKTPYRAPYTFPEV